MRARAHVERSGDEEARGAGRRIKSGGVLTPGAAPFGCGSAGWCAVSVPNLVGVRVVGADHTARIALRARVFRLVTYPASPN